MQRPKFLSLIGSDETAESRSDLQAGARAQTIQRLQVGVAGILVMLLVVALAATLTQRAQSVEDAAVPDAAPTTEPEQAEPQSDPLADAGVVPEIPDEADEAEAGQDTAPNTPDVAEPANPVAAEAEVEDTEAQ